MIDRLVFLLWNFAFPFLQTIIRGSVSSGARERFITEQNPGSARLRPKTRGWLWYNGCFGGGGGLGEVSAKKPLLTLNVGTNGLKVTSEPPPMARQAGCLQGSDRSASHPSKQQPRSTLLDLVILR
ncbi:hypothetical protein J6590_004309 [Homalodisca vitripennis]|nr:hypothetical protein J6590_004309 [Homalodisca vitripennis]